MKLRIKQYAGIYDEFLCVTERGDTIFVDIRVDASDGIPDDNESLIGRIIEVDSLRPFRCVAESPRLVSSDTVDVLNNQFLNEHFFDTML